MIKRACGIALCALLFGNWSPAAEAAQSILSQEDLIKIKSRYREMYPDADKKDVTKPLGGRKKATKQEIDNMKQVVADLRETIKKNADNKPWCAMLQQQIADTYLAMGEFDSAKAEYKKAIDRYPDQKNICAAAGAALEECDALTAGALKAAPANKDTSSAAGPQPVGQVTPAAEPPQPEVPAGAQYIFELKNGRTMQGEIVRETKDNVTIRFSGNTIVFERNEIATYRKAE